MLKENVLLEAESIFDNGQVTLQSIDKDQYRLKFHAGETIHSQQVRMNKNLILEATCTCAESDICSHLASSFLLIRKELVKPKKKKTKSISSKNFIEQIDPEEMKQFVLSRMKANKDFKTILEARFILDVMGTEILESYLDKAFPPNKSTKITPAQKEIRIFAEVIDELLDQIKDLIGRDNYVDSSYILVLLIKKSFYFKNRFESVPDNFLKKHIHLVEILATIYALIEAPSLKAKTAHSILKLLELSYVELIHPKEKSLVINIFKEGIHNAKIIESINSRISIPKSKSYKHFLLTLEYLCKDDESFIISESGEIFIELYNWHLVGYDFFEELITIAKQHRIPVSFIEKLLSLKTTSSNHKELQTELALNSIAKYKSFGIFKWLLTHQEEKWEVYRNQILDDLKNNNDHYTLIRILIHEQSEEELFTYLKDIREIKIYHRFLPDLIKLSETQTFNLYTDWIDEYMSDHFGEMAVIELDSQLKNVQQIDFKLKKKLDKYVLKKYGERPSLST